MLFAADRLCAVSYVRELAAGAGALPDAALTVVLVSRGRCTAALPGGEAAGLGPGGLALAGSAPALTADGACHGLCAGLEGPAARAAAEGLAAHGGLLATDGGMCPAAPEAMAALWQAWQAGAGQAALCAAGCRLVCALMEADAGRPRAAMPPLVTQAVLAMRAHYAELYGAEELSRQLGVSKSHLVRVFSKAMGMGPGQYLTQVRLEAAKAMLAARDWPLETVANLCGFSGANYFCKVFKKHEGCTPAAWRAGHAGAKGADALLEQAEKRMYV